MTEQVFNKTDNVMPSVSVNRASSFNTVKRPRMRKSERDVSKNGRFSFLNRKSKPTKKCLTLEVLQSLTPYQKSTDVVTEEARALLVNGLQTVKAVNSVFFPEIVKDPRLSHEDLGRFPVDKLAVALVAEAISRLKDPHKFYTTIDKNELDDVLQNIYSSVHWKKLGFTLYTKLYPSVVKDKTLGICLQDFIEDDGPDWAERILDNMMEPEWTLKWLQRIIRGLCSEEDYNREMNSVFVKLHLLDPQSVIPAYHFLVNQRALPAVNLELATRNYLGGALDCSLMTSFVEEAISKTSLPLNVSRLSMNDIEIYNGAEVEEFIVTECRNLGIWTGERPSNQKLSTIQDRCSIM